MSKSEVQAGPAVCRILCLSTWFVSLVCVAQERDPADRDRTSNSAESVAAANVEAAFTFQAYLLEDGTPVSGSREFTWSFHDNVSCSDPPLAEITLTVPIEDGVLSTDLPVGSSLFSGRAVWVKLVANTTSLGCTPVRAAPYALSLRPGARIEGPQTGWDGIHVNNTSDTGYSYGVYGSTLSPDGYGGYFRNAGGGAAIKLADGGLVSNQHSAIWISGNGVRPFKHDDSTIIDMTNKGSALVTRGATTGPKNLMLPITVPTLLYGQDVALQELDITWKGETSGEAVSAVILRKQTGICSSCYVDVVFDLSDRTCTATNGCPIHYDIAPPATLDDAAGPLYLTIELTFADADNWIEIGGAKLTIGHD